MKKPLIASRAVALLLILFLGSCGKSEPIVVHSLTLSESSVAFDAEGGERIVSVNPFPEDEEWILNAAQLEWAAVEAVEGGVKITAERNISSQVRTTSFHIVSPESKFDSYKVTISQEAANVADGFVTSAAESYTFDSEGGDYRFTVIAESEWSVESDSEWLTIATDYEQGVVTLSAEPNQGEEMLTATLTIRYTEGGAPQTITIAVEQQTRAENPYYKLVGKWEITANKWFYSPNGSLNSLDYAPNASDYYLIFDIAEGEYGKTLVMENFLYPNTRLEVRYDAETGGFVIPFGWTVLSYNVFFYVTLVGDRQFSYAALEVDVTPSEDGSMLSLALPTVSGYNWVGFGLWTYDDEDNKVALGSNYRPTMFPMGDINFVKKQE